MATDKIIYRQLSSPLGMMTAGATRRGICFLAWSDCGGLEWISGRAERRHKLPLIEGNNPHLDQLAAELADYFKEELHKFKVNLDLAGSDFEMQVWKQLLKIPYGDTRSYGQLARLLGKPGSARAVGHANGANALSIVIPCHRVIEANGALGGYGGKLWRKKYLLELEKGLKPQINSVSRAEKQISLKLK